MRMFTFAGLKNLIKIWSFDRHFVVLRTNKTISNAARNGFPPLRISKGDLGCCKAAFFLFPTITNAGCFFVDLKPF
jgi:hypothetical protein